MGMNDDGPLVDWKSIGRDRFERLVEALISYQHPAGARVDPVDGRGGDGGIDVMAIEPSEESDTTIIYRDDPGRVKVYQLKYYYDGFDGKNKGRQKQIERSLNQAIKNVPRMEEWILVAPCTASHAGWAFLDRLRKKNPSIEISFINRSILDGPNWVAKYPEVARSIVHRDDMRAKAKDYNLEGAILAGGAAQLLDRQLNLNRATDDVDPHWTWRVSALPGEIPTLGLHPKHPGAPDISPVGITFDVDESSAAGAAFARKSAYGLIDPVRLPGEVVSNFVVTGPAFVVDGIADGPMAYLEVHPDTLLKDPKPLLLSFLDSDGNVLKSMRGKVSKAAAGKHGATIRQQFFEDCLIIDWTIPTNPRMKAGASVSQDLGGPRSPEQIRDATSLVLALNELSESMKLTLPDGSVLAHLSMKKQSTPHSADEINDMRKLRETAEDLIAIQHMCGRQFEFPDEASVLDRIDARILRRLLEGKVVCPPEAQLLTVNVFPEALDDEEFHRFITDPSRLIMERRPFGWTLDLVRGQGDQAEIVLDEPFSYFFPELVADNAAEVLSDLQRGKVAKLRMHSPSNLRPRLYLKNRLSSAGVVAPEPWALVGVPEVPELRQD